MSRLGYRMAVLGLLLYAAGIPALEISGVRHDRDHFDPASQESVTIRYTLTDPATVTLNIFDGRDLLIRSLESGVPLKSGEHTWQWDGRDQADRIVPPGAYHYTLQASGSGETVEYDLTDLTGGDDLAARDVEWMPDEDTLHYILPGNARVNIRIGLKDGGPLLRTLVNWVPRRRGEQTEVWDGMDESDVLDLANHPKLLIAVQAFSLSDNTLLVGPETNENRLINDMPWGETRREPKRHPRKRMYAHAQQPLESRGDFSIALMLPDDLARTEEGAAEVAGIVPVRLDIDQKDRLRALTRRFETVFYLDGVFIFENEAGFLPMTWNWDATAVNPGTHYLTANLRGYEGNFGIATLKVDVKPKETPDAE